MTKIPYEGQRIETGPIQFGEDWPGLFIRGDNALGVAMNVDAVLSVLTEEQKLDVFFAAKSLESLSKTIKEEVIKHGT